MSFILQIKNIPDRDLGPIVARLGLPKGISFDVQYVSDKASEGVKTKRVSNKAKLTMTGKVANPDTLLGKGLEAFEKLEAKDGIGTISLVDLNLHLQERGYNVGLAKRLLQTKHLRYLDND